ncbi:juvenile hormone esterase-like [Schistocerca serialis cubense]|uniref:juvenile hormone esterase-like n=1 Tax=Schistocerca serialis cubense TaxID=2023355 RepID=UPI00214E5123|nr:juvenile hormone esterase-like [Schistocerca serialis cubense]
MTSSFSSVFLLAVALTDYTVGQFLYVDVQTTYGVLRGEANITVNGTSYYQFSGVPFAAPPVAELRFKPPQPPAPWDGVREAFEEVGTTCHQSSNDGRISGEEDCLYLNVYTPTVSEDALLPVMVWIFGGHFTLGSNSKEQWGPDFLLDEGVVVVLLNYRVGVMGLLSLSDPIAMGNNVFKDQAAGLQWVQDNIRAFGGDPDQVTLFGQSSGGISVEMHMYSPLSRGLFRAGISMSGSALGGDHIADTNREIAFCIGAELGLQTEDPQELLTFLQSVEANSLYNTSCGVGFMIAIEPEAEGAFMTADHSRLGAWATAGNYTHMPLLTGVTTGEYNLQMQGDSGGEAIIADSVLEQLNTDFEGAIDFVLRLGDIESKRQAATALRQYYFGNITNITADDAVQYAAMMTDLNNGEPADTTVRLLTTTMTQPVFYYQYDYTGASPDIGLPGAWHNYDLKSIWYTPDLNLDPDSDEQKVRNTVIKLWTNFAKYLNPTPEDDPVIEGGWPTYNLETKYFLNIDVNSTVQQNRNAERMDFVHSVSEDALLPVMVWIFGEQFTGGSNCDEDWGPDFYLDQEVVVVLLNY